MINIKNDMIRVRINKKYLLLFLITIVVMCVGCYVMMQEDLKLFTYDQLPQLGLKSYYDCQSTGFFPVYFLVSAFIIPNIFSIEVLSERNSTFSKYIKARTGSQHYFKMNTVANIVMTFLFFLMTHVILLGFIACITPISFQYSKDINVMTSLVNHPFYNLLLYIFLSTLGFTLFSCFIDAMKYFIGNEYIYRGTGLIIGILLVILPMIFGDWLYRQTHLLLFYDVFSALDLTTLITLGAGAIGAYAPGMNSLCLYGFSFATYFLVTLVLTRVSIKEEYSHG